MRLKELFQIKTGYTFRDSIAALEPGTIGVVQAGDINGARLSQIPRISFLNTKHFLREGDILLSVRGNTIAHTVTSDLLPAVAASSVLVLHPTAKHVNPRFIARYLNSPAGQASLGKIMSGAYIKTIRKQELEEIQIPMPISETQDKIVELGQIIDEQKRILRLKELLLTNIYDKAMAITKETK